MDISRHQILNDLSMRFSTVIANTLLSISELGKNNSFSIDAQSLIDLKKSGSFGCLKTCKSNSYNTKNNESNQLVVDLPVTEFIWEKTLRTIS